MKKAQADVVIVWRSTVFDYLTLPNLYEQKPTRTA